MRIIVRMVRKRGEVVEVDGVRLCRILEVI